MSNLKFRLFFIFLAVGFIFVALDVDIKTNIKYPHPYDNSDSVIGEFQYYNIASNYGAKCTYKFIDTSDSTEDMNNNNTISTTKKTAGQTQTKVIDKVFFDNIHIDIFNDIIGFLLILTACFGFRKINKVFSFGFFSAFCGLLLHIIVTLLPFFFNGLFLCNISMVLGIAYLGSIILTTFLFSKGLFLMCPDVCCRDERKWGKISWFISMVLQILLTFIFWIGSDFGALKSLGYMIEGLLVIDIIVFWLILKRAYIYLERSYIDALSGGK
ncbi:MAG: hypothetical protein HFG29_03180 [Eubacterium sp.]|nr:hypothetical protein [Eubacterium sp.]